MSVDKAGQNLWEVVEIAVIVGLILFPLISVTVKLAGGGNPTTLINELSKAISTTFSSGSATFNLLGTSLPANHYVFTFAGDNAAISTLSNKKISTSELSNCFETISTNVNSRISDGKVPALCFCSVYVSSCSSSTDCTTLGGTPQASCLDGQVELKEAVVPDGKCCISKFYRLDSLIYNTNPISGVSSQGESLTYGFITSSQVSSDYISTAEAFTQNVVNNFCDNGAEIVKCAVISAPLLVNGHLVLAFPYGSYANDLVINLRNTSDGAEVVGVRG